MRLYLVIITIIVLISWGYRQVYQYFQAPAYEAKAGVLDLRGYDWQKEPVLRLNGEWNFRPKPSNGNWDTIVEAEVPGLWNDLNLNESFNSGVGVGEYSLTILKNRTEASLAIMINDYLPSTYQLYVGNSNQALISVGHLSRDSSSSTASYGPHWQKLPLKFSRQDTLHLRMVVANHHHRKGGMCKYIEFGTDQPIRMAFNRRVAVELIIASILFFFGLFNIALYFIFARETIFLYLGLFCLATLIRIIASNQSVMHFVWPDAPWNIVQRMRYTSVSAGYLFMVLCFRGIMPLHIHEKATRWLVSLGGMLILIFMVASTYGASQLNILLPAYAFIVVVYLIHGGIRYWQDGNITGSPLLIGGLLYIICGVHDFLFGSNLIYGQFYSAYGLLVLAIMQGVLVIRKFAKIYQANNELAKDLQVSNRKLTEAANLLEDKVQERTQKLAEQNQQLRVLQAYKNQMTSTLVHDLKNPLQIIIGRNQRETGDRVTLQAGQRMLLFVQNLLDIDRAKSKGLTLRLESLRLADIVKESLERLSPFAEHQQIRLRVVVDPQLMVHVDRLLTERIFDNVIHNAIKYSPAQGEVSILATPRQQYIIVEIKDQGPGIREEESGLIFEAYQAKTATAGAHGVGLSFVKVALEEMGGNITFESNADSSGSCFILSIPKQINTVTSTLLPILNEEEKSVFSTIAKALLAVTIYDTSTIKSQLNKLPNQGNFPRLKETILHLSFTGDRVGFINCIQQNMLKDEL